MGYIIETGVPLPPIKRGARTSERLEVLKSLKIGQSVLLDTVEGKRLTLPLLAGRRFATRRVDKNYVRVWRVEQKKESVMSEKFLAHDGVNPAPGDDEPKIPHVVEPEDDDDDDEVESDDEEETDDDEDDDDDDD